MTLAKIQLFEFTTARMVSLKTGGVGYLILNLVSSDFKMFRKYGSKVLHHERTLFIVRPSHGTVPGLPFTIALTVSTQWRLYGTMMSSSS